MWLVTFLQHLDLSSIDEVELAVVIAQAMRVVGVVLYFGRRPARADVLLVLFSVETFVVTGLLALGLASHEPFYGQLSQTVFSTWVASLFVVLPPYLIFAGVSQMARGRGLVKVIIPIGLEFGFLVFAATSVLGFGGSFTLSGFFDLLVALARAGGSGGLIPAIYSVPVFVPSVAVYCALLVYSAIPTASSAVQPRAAFVLPLLGAAVSLAWVYAAVLVLPNSLLSLAVPGFLLVAVLWVYMRR